jgi:ribosomal protein L32
MTYEEFLEFVPSKCMHETIYEDSEGRLILVIEMLDAYSLINKVNVEPCCGEFDNCHKVCMPRAKHSEREACEALCKWRTGVQQVDAAIDTCAAAIRARGQA